jgi:hypothetical protein
VGAAVVVGAVACVFLVVVAVGRGVAQASLWAGVLAALAGIVAAVAAVWPLLAHSSLVVVPPELEVPGWVDRPEEVSRVVSALLGRGDAMVGITTGLFGAGGFGKTTLARVVCADRRIRRRFAGGVFMVTVGRDVRGAAAVAAKVNDLIKLIAGEQATFTDPELAGRRLGALLDAGPRRLLVVDDVWDAGQLAPFTAVGRRCARLVTTRVPGLLGGRDVKVQVDQMSVGQVSGVALDGHDRAVLNGHGQVLGRPRRRCRRGLVVPGVSRWRSGRWRPGAVGGRELAARWAWLWRWRAERAGERGDCFEQERVDAGLPVSRVVGAELADGAAMIRLGLELAYPGGDGGVHWSLTSAAAARAAASSATVFRAA